MRLFRIALTAIVLALVPACRTAEPAGNPAVNLDEATAMAEDALDAFNDGDYGRFSRDWSQTLRDAIPEQGFLSFREQLIGTHGRYVSLDDAAIAPAETAGSMRYEFATTFEQGPMRVALVIPETGDLMEGVFMEPINP
jgi:predicted lipid-binding transport protein (Tim44 family)